MSTVKISVSVALALLSLSPVRAVDGTWKTATGSGVWSDTTKWVGGLVADGAGSKAGLNTGTGGSVFVTIDGAVASRTVGTLDFGGSSIWNVATSGGGTLTFNSSGSAAVINIANVAAVTSTNHSISAPVILTSSLIINGNDPNRGLSVSSVISGAGSITKNGPGLLSLGFQGNNTYVGGFTLNAGDISVSHNNGFGTGTLTLNGGTVRNTGGSRGYANALVLGGNVTFSDPISTGGSNTFSGTTTLTGTRVLTVDSTTALGVTLSGNIGDGGSGYGITKKGAGTLTLGANGGGGSNTFSGDFSLDEGMILLNGSNGVNTQFGTGTLIVNGGSIGSSSFARTVANNVTYNGDANISSGILRTTYSGTGTLTGNRILSNTGDVVYDGLITESGGSWSLTKAGAGTLFFGTGSNTFTGGFKMMGGIVQIAGAGNLAGGAVTVDGGELRLGTLSSIVGAVTINGGTITNTNANGFLSSGAGFAVTGGTINAVLAGSGGLVKSGTGTATLGTAVGSNSYTGATLISAGTLIVSGNASVNSSSGMTINGGTIVYNSSTNLTNGLTFTAGKIAGTNWGGSLSGLTIGAGQTISPGNSPGTAVTVDQTWAGGGSYVWEINNATGTAGVDPGWDLLTGTGTLTLTATSGDKFNINVTSLTLGNVAGDAANFNSASTYEWKIADFDSAITTFDASAFNIDTSAFSNATSGGFSILRGDSVSGGDNTELYLVYVIPEPSTWGLLGLSLTVLISLRRRRTA